MNKIKPGINIKLQVSQEIIDQMRIVKIKSSRKLRYKGCQIENDR